MDLETAVYVSYIVWYSFGIIIVTTIVIQIVKPQFKHLQRVFF